jgi:hypothetical protein
MATMPPLAPGFSAVPQQPSNPFQAAPVPPKESIKQAQEKLFGQNQGQVDITSLIQ